MNTGGKVGNGIVKALRFLLVACFLVLVVDVICGVVSRYFLGGQARWSEELARLLMGWLVFLGAPLAYREGKHLGVDVLTRTLDRGAAVWTNRLVHLLVAVFASWILLYGGTELVIGRWQAGQLLPALQISKAWFYLAIPVSGLLILLAALEALFFSNPTDALKAPPNEGT